MPEDLFKRMDARSKKFFEMSFGEKQKYANNEQHKGGYVSIQTESASVVYCPNTEEEIECRDLREVYSALHPPETPINVDGPQFYCEGAIVEYLHCMDKVDVVLHNILIVALAQAKGIYLPDGHLNDAKGKSTGLLRCSRYRKLSDGKYNDATKLKSHSDWGTITILYSESPGLEEVRDGKWIRVPCRRNVLHGAIDETMSAWSNLRFKNNIHCVSENSSPNRISYGYFAGTGESNEEEGFEPICAEGEVPLFGKISASTHVDVFCKKNFNS